MAVPNNIQAAPTLSPIVAPGADDIDALYAQSREQQDLDDAAAKYERFAPEQAEPSKQDAGTGATGAAITPADIQVRPLADGVYGAFTAEGHLIAGGETEDLARSAALAAADGPTILKPGETAPSTAIDTFSDVAVQGFGGVADSVQGIADLVEPIADFLDSYASLGGVRFTDAGVEYVTPEEMAKLSVDPSPKLPTVPEGRSVFSGLIRGVAQIAFGMKGIGNVLKNVGVKQLSTKGGKLAEMTAKGSAADMLVMKDNQENLSKMLVDLGDEYPFLKNSLTEALATDEDDTAIETKFKLALEGGVIGISATSAIEMSKALAALVRLAKKAVKKAGVKTFKERTGFDNRAALEAAQEADEAGRLKGELDIFTPEAVQKQIDDLDGVIEKELKIIDEETIARTDLEAGTVPAFEASNKVKAATKRKDAAVKARQGIIDKGAESITVEIEVANPETFIKNRKTAAASDDVLVATAISRAAKVITKAAKGGNGGKVTPTELDKFLNAVREGKAPKLPKGTERLLTYLQRKGGLKDVGGELRHMDITSKSRPGLVRKKGRSLDDAALDAWEAGYFPEFPERPAINDLLEAIRKDFSGDAVFSEFDEAAVRVVDDFKRAADELDQLDIDLDAMSNAEVIERLNGQLAKDGGTRTLLDIEVEKTLEAVAIRRTVPNFAKINSTGDIDAAIARMEADNAPLIAKAKGGVISQAETHAAGQELGWKELIALDPKVHGITAARLDALKDFYAASAGMVRKTAEAVAEGPTEGNRFAFRKALMIHEALLERFAAARSEAGRSLNILKRVSQIDNIEAIRGIKEINQELGGPEATDALATLIATAKGLSNEALNNVTQRGVWSRTGAAVREAWTLGLVSGIRTQGRNILSNFAFMLTRLPERSLAARMPGSEIEKGEALVGAAAMMWGTKAAFVNAGKAFWHGTSGFGVGKVDLPRRKAIGGELFGVEDANIKRGLDMIGEFYRVWGRLLVAGDELFKTWNYNAEVAMQAYRQTTKAGMKGKAARDEMARLITEPTENMRMTARLEAQRATFTQEPGVIAKWVMALKRDPNPGIAIPANLMAPFVTTIANITKSGISYTPLAVGMKAAFWKEIQQGGAARDIALAKVALGSMAMSVWSDFVMRGHVTGNGPSDRHERRRWLGAGHRPYSVLIGNEWVSYRSIEPIGTMLGIMADTTEKMVEYSRLREGDDPEYDRKMERLAISVGAAVGNTINSQSFSRGMTEIITVMSQPDMYAEDYLERLSTTLIPKILRSGYELFDVNTSQEWKDVRGVSEALDVEFLPWLGIPLRDALGYPIERADTLPRRSTLEDDDSAAVAGLMNFLSAASPVYVGNAEGGVFETEIWNQGIGFGKPSRRQSFQQREFPGDLGVGVKIDMRDFPEVWDRFQELAGHELIHPVHEMTFENLMVAVIEGRHDDSDYYSFLPDGDTDGVDDKGKYIKAMAEDYRKAAKAAIWEDPDFDSFKEEVVRRSKVKQTKIEELTQ